MHLGGPVVPDEYIINNGWLKGTCANSRTGFSSADFLNSDNRILQRWKSFNITNRSTIEFRAMQCQLMQIIIELQGLPSLLLLEQNGKKRDTGNQVASSPFNFTFQLINLCVKEFMQIRSQKKELLPLWDPRKFYLISSSNERQNNNFFQFSKIWSTITFIENNNKNNLFSLRNSLCLLWKIIFEKGALVGLKLI